MIKFGHKYLPEKQQLLIMRLTSSFETPCDYVIVDCKQQQSNGDYVLSIIDGAANFKKFFKDDSKHEIRLVSESTQEIPPIILHDSDINSSGYMVNGVVVRVVKN